MLEIIGASDIDFAEVLRRMKKLAPAWHKGVILRECFFEPTFHKHVGKLCHGFQFHTDVDSYKHDQFKPFRLVALMLKVIRQMHPKYPIYRDFAYEYVKDRLAFDVINGGSALKDWIEDAKSTPAQLDKALKVDEQSWKKERAKYLLY